LPSSPSAGHFPDVLARWPAVAAHVHVGERRAGEGRPWHLLLVGGRVPTTDLILLSSRSPISVSTSIPSGTCRSDDAG
jgi:hypothetical protein